MRFKTQVWVSEKNIKTLGLIRSVCCLILLTKVCWLQQRNRLFFKWMRERRLIRKQNPAGVAESYTTKHFRTHMNPASVVWHQLTLSGCLPLQPVIRIWQRNAAFLLHFTPALFCLFTTRWSYSRRKNKKQKTKKQAEHLKPIYFTLKLLWKSE